ncbi:MAG: hypothetical protein FWG85_03320 [Bacteroidetes bacterium]|nr:hypothetical protein [Bacteroidota bacterium]
MFNFLEISKNNLALLFLEKRFADENWDFMWKIPPPFVIEKTKLYNLF